MIPRTDAIGALAEALGAFTNHHGGLAYIPGISTADLRGVRTSVEVL